MENNPTKILLCVSGGIAAYKAIDLLSLMVKKGWQVRCILTEGALEFVTPLSFAALSGSSVHTGLFNDTEPIPHIRLAEWADLVVVAPATANVLAKAVQGMADDLLAATLLAHRKPILFVPAMNVYMFEHPATQENLEKLIYRGNHILPPETGRLACGYTGKGKYPANAEIMWAIETYLHYGRDLIGKKVLITAGATLEALDPMRYLSNRSSGRMGLALARAFALRGAEVTLVQANLQVPLPHYLKRVIACETAFEMQQAVLENYAEQDWIVKCAAVADYTPLQASDKKLPKQSELTLELTATPDILAELGKRKKPGQKLIGFAAQSENDPDKARAKLQRKNLDLVLLNNIANAGKEDNEIIVIHRDPDSPAQTIKGDKFTLALRIADLVKSL